MINERELLDQQVEPLGELKEYVVNYVGAKLQPKGGAVTVEMVIEVLAQDFPEIVLAMAEENFIRGYAQGIEDVSGDNPPQPSRVPKDG